MELEHPGLGEGLAVEGDVAAQFDRLLAFRREVELHAPAVRPRNRFDEAIGQLATRCRQDGFGLRTVGQVLQGFAGELDDAKFLKMEAIGDIEPIRKRQQKRIEKLDKSARGALAFLAHLEYPVDGTVLAERSPVPSEG